MNLLLDPGPAVVAAELLPSFQHDCRSAGRGGIVVDDLVLVGASFVDGPIAFAVRERRGGPVGAGLDVLADRPGARGDRPRAGRLGGCGGAAVKDSARPNDERTGDEHD